RMPVGGLGISALKIEPPGNNGGVITRPPDLHIVDVGFRRESVVTALEASQMGASVEGGAFSVCEDVLVVEQFIQSRVSALNYRIDVRLLGLHDRAVARSRTTLTISRSGSKKQRCRRENHRYK